GAALAASADRRVRHGGARGRRAGCVVDDVFPPERRRGSDHADELGRAHSRGPLARRAERGVSRDRAAAMGRSKQILIAFASVVLGCVGCAPHAPTTGAHAAPSATTTDGGAMSESKSPDAEFRAFEEKFLADSLALDPTAATKAGDHSHDGAWPDPSVEGEAATRAFYVDRGKQLDAFSGAHLS